MTKQKEKSIKESEQLMKHLSTKIQEVASNVVITEENEKQGPEGHFQINLPLTLMVLLMNHCDVQAVANTFVDDSK